MVEQFGLVVIVRVGQKKMQRIGSHQKSLYTDEYGLPNEPGEAGTGRPAGHEGQSLFITVTSQIINFVRFDDNFFGEVIGVFLSLIVKFDLIPGDELVEEIKDRVVAGSGQKVGTAMGKKKNVARLIGEGRVFRVGHPAAESGLVLARVERIDVGDDGRIGADFLDNQGEISINRGNFGFSPR